MVEEDKLAEGYKAMAGENEALTEEFLPATPEEWPIWEDKRIRVVNNRIIYLPKKERK